jgi:hypothetical protein
MSQLQKAFLKFRNLGFVFTAPDTKSCTNFMSILFSVINFGTNIITCQLLRLTGLVKLYRNPLKQHGN